jgi:hypothetical protein
MDVMLVVLVVMMMMMVVARTSIRRHGEHRQHGCDGEELGEGHGELLSSGVNGRNGTGAASCQTSDPRTTCIVPGIVAGR